MQRGRLPSSPQQHTHQIVDSRPRETIISLLGISLWGFDPNHYMLTIIGKGLPVLTYKLNTLENR